MGLANMLLQAVAAMRRGDHSEAERLALKLVEERSGVRVECMAGLWVETWPTVASAARRGGLLTLAGIQPTVESNVVAYAAAAPAPLEEPAAKQPPIGKQLAAARVAAGLTQREAARRLGLAGSARISDHEKDKNDPTTDVVRRYSELYGRSFVVGEGPSAADLVFGGEE